VITADRWYDSKPDLNQHYQGDVIRDIPFPIFPTALPPSKEDIWPLLRPYKTEAKLTVSDQMKRLPQLLLGRAAKDTPDRWASPDGEFIAAHTKKQNVMILSRSCSLDYPARKHHLFAPVYAIDGLPEDQRKTDKIEAMRRNEIPHCFYLPALGELRESFANLMLITPIHRDFIPNEGVAVNLVARLSSWGMSALQQHVSAHFGQKFGFDFKDICPQDGRYSCANCFFAGQPTKQIAFKSSAAFGKCEICGEDVAWIKLP
jgi:hypothetical protein